MTSDPLGLENPHREGCLICGARKRVVLVRDDTLPGGYSLIRICNACDAVPETK